MFEITRTVTSIPPKFRVAASFALFLALTAVLAPAQTKTTERTPVVAPVAAHGAPLEVREHPPQEEGGGADRSPVARSREKKYGTNGLGPELPLFLTPALYDSNGWAPQSLAVGDLNNDGKPDLVVANLCAPDCTGNSTVGVLLGNGDGTFQLAVSYDSGGIGAVSVAIADVNGDHKPDLIVADCGEVLTECQPTVNSTVAILIGNGDGTFQPGSDLRLWKH